MKNAVKTLLFWYKKHVLFAEFKSICAKYNELETGCSYTPKVPINNDFGGFCDELRAQVETLLKVMENDLGDDKPYALSLAALEVRLAGFALRITREQAW